MYNGNISLWILSPAGRYEERKRLHELEPERYVDYSLARSLMKALWADKLRIIPHPKSSRNIFRLG